MEKEQILSTINEKLNAEGIKTDAFQRTFGAYIDGNLPTEGTEPDDAYWQKHVGILKSISGQFSHDVAQQVNDFKKNYKPVTNPEDKSKGEVEKSDFEKRLEQLENAQKESARNASVKALRSEVGAKGKSLKVANEAIWEDAVKAVYIGEKESADDVTTKAKKEYERMLKRYYGEGVSPYGSSGRQGASEEAKKESLNRRERHKQLLRSRGKLPKSE